MMVPKWSAGIFSAVCIVVPSIFTVATPVGAMSKNFGLSSDTFLYEKFWLVNGTLLLLKITYHSLHHQLRRYAMVPQLLMEKMICF